MKLSRFFAVILIVCLASVITACKESPLYTALKEQQANEVEASLLVAGIDANKHPAEDGELWSVSVPKKQVPRAMAVLKEQGLPRASNITMGDVFKKEGFVSSPLEERARYLYALSQELSSTLMEIDGVVSSRVHVALPEKTLLDDKKQSASVSVVIIQEKGVDLSMFETDIKAIVTDGVEGLDDVNRVTVKFFTRKVEYPSMPEVDDLDSSEILPETMIVGLSGLAIGVVASLILMFMYFRRQRKQVELPQSMDSYRE